MRQGEKHRLGLFASRSITARRTSIHPGVTGEAWKNGGHWLTGMGERSAPTVDVRMPEQQPHQFLGITEAPTIATLILFSAMFLILSEALGQARV